MILKWNLKILNVSIVSCPLGNKEETLDKFVYTLQVSLNCVGLIML